MAGMDQVKETVNELVTRRHLNYAREMEGKEPLKGTFNHVFLGPPGTGKTTVATLFGQIIADLGYIEDSKVVIKKPTDFLGQYVGQSEDMTRDILDETEGKVLIIDEAHMFYHGSEHGTDKSDIFRKGIIDTIVAHVDNEPGSNRCIILMGYPDRMKEFYRNTNPGFQRRFPLDTAFVFEDYDDKALHKIMDIMLAKDEITATPEAKDVAMEVLRRERDRPNFGNGGAVRNLISRAQVTYSKRIALHAKENPQPGNDSPLHVTEASQIVLEPQDFDSEYDRGLRANKDFRSLFKDLVGFRDITGIFEGYQKMTANMKQHGLDPREEIPFSFVFKGPPGTGKTTTARALGHIYHSMGFLSTTEVMDCSVTDLVSSNGLTGQKVQNLLERGLGKVLFIDEAYRMGQRDLTGAFISRLAQEAVGELVDCITKEKFAGKLVIVLAGYEKDMDQLMSTNEGLRGRFTEMMFPNMRPKDCLRLLQKKLEHRKISILHSGGKQVLDKVIGLFDKLSKTEAWANARDVESIAKRITRRVFMKELPTQGTLDITLEEIAAVLKQLYQQRRPQNVGDES
ncbi:P-loop containing nucleoside triphosphate hydrolase protein [Mytilinidion resinicola]|uniref:P-loop containing nucleoside triphosphate hydrolase protein n=1 Tax=Mytilinidion resinicola TaxID=574789 RepID=A0A6A6Y0C7_9PEZI|nr:P-loop containing nucleoside triphosphate hydrolase protein [Mytilinidion resinicola]KAF2802276.1 P-loop containing nucleoside triphosphate hydrolase protein [Mytilinidion resinicola]